MRAKLPDFGTGMLEKLKKFRNKDVEGSAESLAVQDLGRIFANLLQGSKRTLE